MKRSLIAAVAAAALTVAAPIASAAPGHGKGNGNGNGHGHGHQPSYLLGAAVEDINPTQAQIDAKDFCLGGYGLSSGKPANAVDVPVLTDTVGNRYATGVLVDSAFPNHLADGVHVRAMVIGAGQQAIALAQIETQGYFSAYKQGPFGIVDIRKDAAAAIARLGGPAM